jgi:hypothetical protein
MSLSICNYTTINISLAIKRLNWNEILIALNQSGNFNIPDYSIVIVSPARLMQKMNPTKDYINY